MSLPNRLRVRDGLLVLEDGSDAREYLRAWAVKAGVSDETPVTLLKRDVVQRLKSQAAEADPDHRFALAS